MKENMAKLQSKAYKQAEEALTNAGREESIEAFTAAILHAEEIGVSNYAITKSKKILQVLIEEVQRKQEVENACVKAAENNDIEMLAENIFLATKLGIGEGPLRDAKGHLHRLQDEAEKRREVEDEMSRAQMAGDIESLATSIQRAQEVGVCEYVVMFMKENMAKLQSKAYKQAEEALMNAGKEESIEALTAAISHAEQVGASNCALTQSRKRLQVLIEKDQRKQEVENACVKAIENDDIQMLAASI